MASHHALATRLQNLQRRAAISSQQIERRLAISAAAAGLGYLESRGTLPVSVVNMPTKLVLGLGLAAAETQFSGSSRRLISAAADAAIAVYMHDAAKSRSFIAGEDYVGGIDNVGEL